MEEKHFFAVHTFVSDEVRSQFVTPPEKRNPPKKREIEKEWVEKFRANTVDACRLGSVMRNFSTVIGLPRANKTFTDNSTNSILVLTD